jgi:hypothetical protein
MRAPWLIRSQTVERLYHHLYHTNRKADHCQNSTDESLYPRNNNCCFLHISNHFQPAWRQSRYVTAKSTPARCRIKLSARICTIRRLSCLGIQPSIALGKWCASEPASISDTLEKPDEDTAEDKRRELYQQCQPWEREHKVNDCKRRAEEGSFGHYWRLRLGHQGPQQAEQKHTEQAHLERRVRGHHFW